jgi:hypothetical protein
MGTQQPNIHGKIHDVYTWNVFCWGTGYVNRTQNLYGISIIIIENNFAGVHMSFRGPTYVVSTFCVREVVLTCRRTVRTSTVRTVLGVLRMSTVLYSVHSNEDGTCRIVRSEGIRKLMCTPVNLFSMMIMEIENNFAGVHKSFQVL